MPNNQQFLQPILVEECPACNSRSFSEAGSAHGVHCRLGEHNFVQPHYVIRQCSNCALLYRTPNLSDEELDSYYSLVDYRKWEVPGFFPTENAILERLRELSPGARVLDFGCSSGRLLEPLVRSYKCFGFEIAGEAARIAHDKGITILTPAEFNSGSCGFFEAIVLSDVFEHLSKPTDLLRHLVNLLKPGGELIIVTGNSDAPACQLDPAQFWYFRTVEHLCMINHRHAEFLSQKLSVSIVEWKQISHYKVSLRERVFQHTRHFAYWQFRNNTVVARLILRWAPVLKRARTWKIAPAYTASDDHVLAVFKKP